MRTLKREIFFVLLFMVIGIAAVTTNVIVNMSTPINQNPDDFLVYFSDVEVDGEQDLSLVENEQKLVFNGEFTAVGDKKVITYDITNASSNYDADVLISCTQSTTYLTITNAFDMKSSLSARSTKTGTLTIELSTAVSEEVSQEVTCTIEANAVERESKGSGDVNLPVKKTYAPGTELLYRGELFNVVKDDGNYVTLLARYNLDSTYKQSETANYVLFADTTGWAVTPRPQEVDIQLYDGPVKTYVNEYVTYLKGATGDDDITGNLITITQLGHLGCVVSQDYSYVSGVTCIGSENESWIINGQNWWTRSAYSSDSVWRVATNGGLNYSMYSPSYGVRPTITVSSTTFENMSNAAQNVCAANGWDYGKDTGTNYRCSNSAEFVGYCTYTYNGVQTGGCGGNTPI